MDKLTHIDSRGMPRMVDVGDKPPTSREAVASAYIEMKPETLGLIMDKKISKGDVLSVATIAGIMGAKKCGELIPLCHPLNLTSVEISFHPDEENSRINIKAVVKCSGKTGVEMEALLAVSTAALCIYDMCKAVDKGMIISNIMLEEKRGGRSGEWKRRL